jgi:putative endonuclease
MSEIYDCATYAIGERRRAKEDRVISIEMQSRVMRRMNSLAERLGGRPATAAHLATGERGEQEALFQLRKLGYVVVARRWKTAKLWGDVDLIAWDGECLCFVEVKTRSQRDATAALAAADRDKREMLQRMARAYLRGFPEKLRGEIQVRFDVVSVYLLPSGAEFDLYRAAFGWN